MPCPRPSISHQVLRIKGSPFPISFGQYRSSSSKRFSLKITYSHSLVMALQYSPDWFRPSYCRTDLAITVRSEVRRTSRRQGTHQLNYFSIPSNTLHSLQSLVVDSPTTSDSVRPPSPVPVLRLASPSLAFAW
jgi:hypothetical protein